MSSSVKVTKMVSSEDTSHGWEGGSFLTRSKMFKNLCKWAFSVCDNDKTGEISKPELYTGVLLVHLKIAKYAGAAATFPASRETVDKLFEKCDADNSGTIDEEEFSKIMVICCGQILSRVLIYLALLLFISPMAGHVMVLWLTKLLADQEWFQALFHMVQDPIAKVPWLDAMFDWDTLAEDVFGMLFFFAAFPVVFGTIDKFYQAAAEGEMLAALEPKKKTD